MVNHLLCCFLFGRSLAVVGISTLYATNEMPSAPMCGRRTDCRATVACYDCCHYILFNYEPSCVLPLSYLTIAKSDPLLALPRQLLFHGLHQANVRVGALAHAHVVPGCVWSMMCTIRVSTDTHPSIHQNDRLRLTASAAPPAASRPACPRRRAAACPAPGPRRPPSTAAAALCM